MSVSRKSYLIKNTAIFALGNFATKIITFFLIPIYTNALTTSQYGTVDLISTISTIAIPLLTLNISEAVMRFNLDKNANYNKITKIGIMILLLGMIFGIILIPISTMFNDLAEFAVYIYFYAVLTAASQLFLADLRGKEMLFQYSIGNILNTLLIAIFNILFLLVFNLGIKGYLLAYILSAMVVTCYAFIIGRGFESLKTTLDVKICKKMLKYSIVLIPNSFMWWIMNSSDHIMVTSFMGVAANGIYAISYKLPTLVSSIMQIFNMAWGYSAIKEEGAMDEEEYNNRVLKNVIMAVMIIGIGMMTITKPFLRIYVSDEYFSAWKYTPFLIIGCVYSTLATFMSTSYTVHKDSFGFMFSGLFGGFLNIILNFILIEKIGIYGAAFATCMSYTSVLIFRAVHTRKYIKYNLFNKEFVIGTIFMIASSILMYVDSSCTQWLQIIIFLFALYFFKNVWCGITKFIFEIIIKKVKSDKRNK